MSLLWKITAFVAILVAVRLSVFTVDASEFAYVTVLGRHVATYDGGGDGAGLYVGWPWPIQAVQRLDRRVQQFDLPASEHLTTGEKDKVDKNLSIETYVVWRIQDQEAVNRFVTRIGTQDRVLTILKPRIISKLGKIVGRKKMDDFINPDEGVVDKKMSELHRELLDGLKEQVLEQYGIELIDIRLRRFNYPKETSKAIFDRIISERQTTAEKYRADGDREAKKILDEANEQFRTRVAEAKLEQTRLKGERDAATNDELNRAQAHDKEFYEFLKSMETLSNVLSDNRAILVMSTKRPLFQGFFNPPRLNDAPPNVAPSAPDAKKGKP